MEDELLKAQEELKNKCIDLCIEAKSKSMKELREELNDFSEKDQILIKQFIERCNKCERSPNPDPIVNNMSNEAKNYAAKMAFKIAMEMWFIILVVKWKDVTEKLQTKTYNPC